MSAFVLSQILASVAFLFGLSSFQCRDRRYTLLLLSAAQMSFSIHFFLLDAVTAGFVVLIVALRSFVAIWITKSFVMYFFIILISVIGVLTLTYNYDLLPVMGGILGTLAVFSVNEKKMRHFFMGATSVAIIFNVIIFSPVAIVSELFFLGSILLSYWRFYIRKKEI